MIILLVGWALFIGESRKTRKIHEAQSRRARTTRIDKCGGCKKSVLACTCGQTRSCATFSANGRLWCSACSSLWRAGHCTNVRCAAH